jgi:hypothetical protein
VTASPERSEWGYPERSEWGYPERSEWGYPERSEWASTSLTSKEGRYLKNPSV